MGPDQVERVLMGTAKYAAIRRVNPDAYAKIAEIFAKGLQRGMSIADLHREIYPIGLAVVSDVLPHASPQQLIDFARFMIGVGKKLNADSSGSCYFHFNPQKNSGEFLGAMEKHKDIRTAEDELLLRILNSFDGKRVPPPAEGEIAAALEKVQRVLIRRFGDDLDLLAADDVPPAKYSAYCSMLVAAYEQALTLPQSESVPLLRFMFANR